MTKRKNEGATKTIQRLLTAAKEKRNALKKGRKFHLTYDIRDDYLRYENDDDLKKMIRKALIQNLDERIKELEKIMEAMK